MRANRTSTCTTGVALEAHEYPSGHEISAETLRVVQAWRAQRLENESVAMSEYSTKIGHAHLKVRDLDRATAFYTRFFSLQIIERVGDAYVFLSGGEFHHEIALQNVGAHAPPPPREGTGLYHVAFEVPDKISFARAYKALSDAGVKVASVDHCISWAMYFDDPDGNGLEIYWDARHEPDGVKHWRGINLPLEGEDILAELEHKEN